MTELIPKTLHNTNDNSTSKNVKDVVFFGKEDLFVLMSKASSDSEGWMKSTKACEILGVGCIVQVTTQQRNIDGTYSISEALTFVPGVSILTRYGHLGEVLRCFSKS